MAITQAQVLVIMQLQVLHTRYGTVCCGATHDALCRNCAISGICV